MWNVFGIGLGYSDFWKGKMTFTFLKLSEQLTVPSDNPHHSIGVCGTLRQTLRCSVESNKQDLSACHQATELHRIWKIFTGVNFRQADGWPHCHVASQPCYLGHHQNFWSNYLRSKERFSVQVTLLLRRPWKKGQSCWRPKPTFGHRKNWNQSWRWSLLSKRAVTLRPSAHRPFESL